MGLGRLAIEEEHGASHLLPATWVKSILLWVCVVSDLCIIFLSIAGDTALASKGRYLPEDGQPLLAVHVTYCR